jgi:hypothetical protein
MSQAQETKEVQAPPLMPWENTAEVRPETAMEEFAGELENDLFGSQGARKPKAKPRPQEDEDEEDAEVEASADDEESDEDDEESAAEGQEDEEEAEYDFEEDEFEQIARARPHRPKVDGEVVEVTYEELLAGYSRTADYTRKSQQREEERRAEKTANMQVREQLVGRLKTVEQALEEMSPEKSPEYWDKLRVEKPEQFAVEFAQSQLNAERKRKLREKREAEEHELQREQEEQFRDYAQAEYGKLQRKLGWKNDDEARTALQSLWDFAQSEFGFTQQEMTSVIDSRLLLLLHAAHEGSKRQKKGAEKIKEKLKQTKTLKPGGKSAEPPVRRGRKVNRKAVNRAMKDLQETGSPSAAASLFEQLLD